MEDDATRRSRALDLSWSVHSSLIQTLPVHDFESDDESSGVVGGVVMRLSCHEALEEKIRDRRLIIDRQGVSGWWRLELEGTPTMGHQPLALE